MLELLSGRKFLSSVKSGKLETACVVMTQEQFMENRKHIIRKKAGVNVTNYVEIFYFKKTQSIPPWFSTCKTLK